ncbi:hypothetical protein EJB05_34398, partial [Eragrostis curvula]
MPPSHHAPCRQHGSGVRHISTTVVSTEDRSVDNGKPQEGISDNSKPPWEYSLRKYLLLLATLVATVTYTAGFAPPGGVWQETDPGHLAGDPIIRYTSKLRYVAFFYSNATAFGSSLVVIGLILILSRYEMRGLAPVAVLRGFMVADLLSLMVAYTAGIYRDRDVPVYSMVLAALTVVYVVVFHMMELWKKSKAVVVDNNNDTVAEDDNNNNNNNKDNDDNINKAKKFQSVAAQVLNKEHDASKTTKFPKILPLVRVLRFLRRPARKPTSELEKDRKVLMLLATFAVSVTYLAGLNAPGGFWNHAEGDHQPGDPILMDGRHEARLKLFVHLNSTAFFWSLVIAMQLLDKNLCKEEKVRFRLLYTSIVVALLGLVGAYATGSSRDMETTIYITLLVGAVPACIPLFRVILPKISSKPVKINGKDQGEGSTPQSNHSDAPQALGNCFTNKQATSCFGKPAPWNCFTKEDDDSDKKETRLEKARSLVLLLATLAATITYQAGLDPPGGLWEDDGVGYKAGDPILLTTNPRRFKAFFYCNSVAFVASLVAIILVKYKKLLRYHALEAAMILDLFGLIGAYAAGSCRDVNTSIYAMALAGAVLVYVVIHVVFFTLDHHTRMSDEAIEVVEKRRKTLLLFAILAATITYQAGLTPPGGFRLQDDGSGHLADDPVLLYNFPRRYKAFFYCNSVSFMLSIALILLLVNPNLYRPAIKSHALSICMAAGVSSLVGAYAAGSTQHLKTSIKIFGLVAAILIVVVLVVLLFVICSKKDSNEGAWKGQDKKDKNGPNDELHSKQKYLMLLGILGASVTYQAGLKPPGGVWQANNIGHVAGNPIMYDNGRIRYQSFFYINSTSFMSSIIVIILLLLKLLHKDRWLLRAMNITIVLDLVGLLVAYAVGSSRSWKTTIYVFALVVAVLVYIAIHVILSWLIRRDDKKDSGATKKKKEEHVAITSASLSNKEANGGDQTPMV